MKPDAAAPSPPAVAISRARRVCLGAAAAWLAGAVWGADAPDEQPDIVNLELPGATIELQFTPGFDAAQRESAREWALRGADVVSRYFGRFPVPQLELLLQGVDGAGVRSGVSFGEPSPLVRVRLGRDTTVAQFRGDWVLVHEFVHLAVPRVPRNQIWLHEGIATYVEMVARARAGLIAVPDLWRSWLRQMPIGQPGEGDRGLDHTPTWARIYWGGAMFCLLADVRLRQRGAPARGLQQALQGVLAAGGDYRVAWPVSRILATADAALGQRTLSELYAELKDDHDTIDLATLWRDLGVDGDTLRDDAPLAAVRRAITD